MAQWFRVLTAHAENLDLAPRTHISAHFNSYTRESYAPSDHHGLLHAQDAHIHTETHT